LPKPADLDIYLGEGGLYYRVANANVEIPVAVGADGTEEPEVVVPSPGVPLYSFEG
jgi:hypothetical protein